ISLASRSGLSPSYSARVIRLPPMLNTHSIAAALASDSLVTSRRRRGSTLGCPQRNDATLGYKDFVMELDRLAYTDLTAVIRLPGERWSSRPVATAPTGHRLLGSPKTRAGRGCFAYEHHRPAIAYSRVGTGRTHSAVPSSNNFRASLLGSDLGLI